MKKTELVIIKNFAQVQNYEVEVFNVPSEIMSFKKNVPPPNDETEMYMAIKNIPFELSERIEKAIIKAMSNQREYEKLLKALDLIEKSL